MKKLGKILCIFGALLLFSGCMKYNMEFTVNNDGSVDLKYLTAISKEMMQYTSEDQKNKNYDNLEGYGFQVKKYDDGDFEGYEMTKHFNSIDELTYEGNQDVDLSMDNGKVQLFTVTKNGDKKTYKASLKSSEANGYSSQSEDYSDNDQYKDMLKGMEMKFIITLPVKATTSNATNVSNDGKTLEWDFLTFKEKAIEFEFTLGGSSNNNSNNNNSNNNNSNNNNADNSNSNTTKKDDNSNTNTNSSDNNNLFLYIGIGVGAAAVVGVIVFIILNKKNKAPQSDITQQ